MLSEFFDIVALPSLLSITVASCATLLATPFAIIIGWLLARHKGWWMLLLETIVMLPLILTPVTTGLCLYFLLSSDSWIGRLAQWIAGGPILMSWGAAVAASMTVGIPLYIRSVQQAFLQIPQHFESAAQALGASSYAVFLGITLPLSRSGILYGALLCFARGIGEFGATLLVAGNTPGKTQTLALAISVHLQKGQQREAWYCAIASFILALITFGLSQFFFRPARPSAD